MPKRQLTVRLPNLLFHQLDAHTQDTGFSKTDIVVAALSNYLGEDGSEPVNDRISKIEKRISELEDQSQKTELNEVKG
ncbi:MAG: DNA-binding domain-containing protein [Cyanobacteria bacterium SID2]|nr:DNA-binding domain-containing protein [Cyanobacteria bacterium SID2]MBP0006584.1 DNA-binding domain-containing protein [Cyanobacteria bacterium SBC]